MICWLASYPRSGNTLFRILVHRFFGVETWSRHGDSDAHDIKNTLSDVVGFVPHDALDDAKLRVMAAGDAFALVKTHDLPPADNAFPAICIVRDGRSAIASYWHYRNRPGDVGATLGDVLTKSHGQGGFEFGRITATLVITAAMVALIVVSPKLSRPATVEA